MVDNQYLPVLAKIVQIQTENTIDKLFRLKTHLSAGFGQFFQVSLPGIGEAPISVSDFGSGWLEFMIRRTGQLTEAIHHLETGDKLYIRGPYGRGFDLTDLQNKQVIITAGGSGIAPVKSLINYFYHHTDQIVKLDLLFGFKNMTSAIFSEEIKRWSKKFNTLVTVDETCDLWSGECVGLVTKYINEIQTPDLKNVKIIIVGPPVMINFSAKEFLKMGISENKILVSLERRMSCGVGKCGHCKISDTYICLDGPVFPYSRAINLLD